MSLLNLAHFCVTDGVNGPGRRFTVWVQGCPHDCPGCFNPGLGPLEPRWHLTPEELAAELAAAGPVNGLTLSGGEPFAQAAALTRFLDAAAGSGLRPLPVIAFSGYTLEELRAGPPEWSRLLARVDLLVDGPYRQEAAAGAQPLTGSANQRRVALTTAGARLLERVGADASGRVQILVTGAGEVLVSGFPSQDLLLRLRSGLHED